MAETLKLTAQEASMVINLLQLVLAGGGSVTQENDFARVTVTAPKIDAPDAKCRVEVEHKAVLTRSMHQVALG